MSKHLLTSRGLIIVLKSHSRDYVSPGKQLFYHFQTANEVLYWNSNLYEAVHNCQLIGYILPSTLLLSGPDIFLETIKLAWSKRLLKAPKGYSLEMVGEFAGIEMRRIQQVHFIPLDEALCYIIYDLNCNNRESSFDTVVSKLAEWYRGMQLPPSELILNTLRQLMEKRQVYHTGYGYSILTTDKAAVADWLVRLPSSPSQFPMDPVSPLKRSGSTSDISSLGGGGPYHSRRWSVREPLRRHHLRRFSPPPVPVQERLPWSADSGLPTSQSHLTGPSNHLQYLLTPADSRSPAALSKQTLTPAHQAPHQPSQPSPPVDTPPAAGPDNNNGPAAAGEVREPRGKSPSLFRKLLSLGKAKRRDKSGAKAAPSPGVGGGGGVGSPDEAPPNGPCGGRRTAVRTELAVFSGQFPPPEWLWYLNHQQEAKPGGLEAVTQRLGGAAAYPAAWLVDTERGRRRAASDEDLPSLPSPMQPLASFPGPGGRSGHGKAAGAGRRSGGGQGEKKRSHHHHHHHHHHHKHAGGRGHRQHRSARHLSTGGVEMLGLSTSGDLLDEPGRAVMAAAMAASGGTAFAMASVGAGLGNGNAAGGSGGVGGRKAKLRQSKSMHERLHVGPAGGGGGGGHHHHLPSSTSGPSSVGTTPVQECSPGGFGAQAPGGPASSGGGAGDAGGSGGGGDGGGGGGPYDDSGFHSSRNTTEADVSESKCSMLKARYHHYAHHHHQHHQHPQNPQEAPRHPQQQQASAGPGPGPCSPTSPPPRGASLQHRLPSPPGLLGASEGHYGSLDRALLRKHGWPPLHQAQMAALVGAKSPAASSGETETGNSSSASADQGSRHGVAGPAATANGLETVLEASTQELAQRGGGGAGNRSESSIFVETDLDAAILAV